MVYIIKNYNQECKEHSINGILFSGIEDNILMKNIQNVSIMRNDKLVSISMAMCSFMAAEHETWVPLGFSRWVFIPGTSAGLILRSLWESLQMASNKTTIDPM